MYTLCQITTLLCTLMVTLPLAQSDMGRKSPLYIRYKRDKVRLPPSIQEHNTPSHILYKEGIEVSLPCVATGTPPPSYEWMRNGGVLDLNEDNMHVNRDVGSIKIQPMKRRDEGYYQCLAKNIHGTSASKVFFLQRAEFGQYGPASVKSYTNREGMPLKLECLEITSTPTPSYSWALVMTTVDENPTELKLNRRIIRDEDGNLYFSYLTKEDARIVKDLSKPSVNTSLLYKCNVFNKHLDYLNGGSYSRIIVTDGGPTSRAPSLLHATQSPYIAIKGRNIRIQCIFAGKPLVSITWDPMPGGRSNIHEHGTVLEIENVQFSDEGVYTCTARNSVSEVRESIQVDVQSSPEFEVQPFNLNATEKETVSVDCRVALDTEPPAVIQWFINGEPVERSRLGPRSKITNSGQRLTMSNLCKDCSTVQGQRGSDLQVIQCNASNVHGSVFANGYLNVLLKTVIFTMPQDQNIDHDTAFALFDCQAKSDASTPVSITWLHKNKPLYADQRLVVNRTSGLLMVKLEGLKLEQRKKYEGEYTCRATNSYSTQEATAMLIITYTGTGAVVGIAGKIWWIILILILIFLLLILLCCCCWFCLCYNRGNTYPVDEKEREHGNDPEKECEDSGFHDYHRLPADLYQYSDRTDLLE